MAIAAPEFIPLASSLGLRKGASSSTYTRPEIDNSSSSSDDVLSASLTQVPVSNGAPLGRSPEPCPQTRYAHVTALSCSRTNNYCNNKRNSTFHNIQNTILGTALHRIFSASTTKSTTSIKVDRSTSMADPVDNRATFVKSRCYRTRLMCDN